MYNGHLLDRVSGSVCQGQGQCVRARVSGSGCQAYRTLLGGQPTVCQGPCVRVRVSKITCTVTRITKGMILNTNS